VAVVAHVDATAAETIAKLLIPPVASWLWQSMQLLT